MAKEIRQAVLFTLITMPLCGGAYHGVIWAVGRVAFSAQAEGSLIRGADGTVVGSRLIAQKFTRAEYFHPRPSGVDYNAASTGGTNYGPSNPDHLKAVQERLDAATAQEGVAGGAGAVRDGDGERRRSGSAHPAGGGRPAGAPRRRGARRAARSCARSSSRPTPNRRRSACSAAPGSTCSS